MFDMRLDLREFERRARQLGAVEKQLPYALSLALNDTIKQDVEPALQTEMRSAFDRPTPFTMRAVGLKFSHKKKLRAEVYVRRIQAQYLAREWKGGARRPKNKALPVPGKGMNLNAYGNMPKGAVKRLVARKDTFIGRPGRGDRKSGPVGIWQRPKRGKRRGGTVGSKGRLELLVLLSGAQDYDPRFDFDGVISRTVTKQLPYRLVGAVRRAMATAR